MERQGFVRRSEVYRVVMRSGAFPSVLQICDSRPLRSSSGNNTSGQSPPRCGIEMCAGISDVLLRGVGRSLLPVSVEVNLILLFDAFRPIPTRQRSKAESYTDIYKPG